MLNQTFVPDVASSGQHLADLAAGLVKRGHQVTVVTSRRAYAEPRVRFPAKETWRGVRVLRVGVFSFGRGTIWRRILDALSFAVFSYLRICRLPRPDVIVALTSPPLISVVGLWLARLRRCQFVCWVMDLNPDEAVAAGCLRADSPLGICLEWLSRMTLRNANRVVVLDRFMFSRIAAKGVPSSRITVVPPWSQDSEVHLTSKAVSVSGDSMVWKGNSWLCTQATIVFAILWTRCSTQPACWLVIEKSFFVSSVAELNSTISNEWRDGINRNRFVTPTPGFDVYLINL